MAEPEPEPEAPRSWEDKVALATAAGVAVPAVFHNTSSNAVWLAEAALAAAKTTASECACSAGYEALLPLRDIRPPRFEQEPEPPRYLDRRRQWYGGVESNERVLWNAIRATIRGVAVSSLAI